MDVYLVLGEDEEVYLFKTSTNAYNLEEMDFDPTAVTFAASWNEANDHDHHGRLKAIHQRATGHDAIRSAREKVPQHAPRKNENLAE